MNTHIRPQSNRTLYDHASGIVRLSPFIAGFALIIAIGTTCFSQISIRFLIVAILAGGVSFPILWVYWKRANAILFYVLIMLLIASHNLAHSRFFPADGGVSYWLLFAQYISIYFFSQLSLVFGFRRRLIASMRLELQAAEQDGPPNDPPPGSFEGGSV